MEDDDDLLEQDNDRDASDEESGEDIMENMDK